MPTTRLIKDKLATLPSSPGVYLMKDVTGKVIYVGKATVLKHRVRSYFQSTKKMEIKTRALTEQTADFEVIQTETETEAFILEDNLIKRYQPRFNIRLRDDKHYPYLRITNETFPRVLITRRRNPDGARYYGPYTNAKAMRSVLKLAQKLFLIRACNLALPLSAPRRPCLSYHIGRCSGPCAGIVTEGEYAQSIEQAVLLLSGKIPGLLSHIRTQMNSAVTEERFEEATRLRDQIVHLGHTLQRQSVVLRDMIDRDIIGIALEGEQACANVFFIREGRLTGRETFHLLAPGDPDIGAVLTAFISQYYAKAAIIPREILIPTMIEQEALSRWLCSLRRRKVTIKVPRRGEKHRLLTMASNNARHSLRSEQLTNALHLDSTLALSELTAVLSLPCFPYRIEAFDISNTQGQQATGSMVVFKGGKPLRDAYRRFKVRASGKPNDYAMMAEVLRRRFRRGFAELNDPSISRGSFSDFPDLLLVDGGKGQLNIAMGVLKELKIDEIPAIGLAKRHEQVFQFGNPDPISLSPDSKALLLLRAVRDEAHRFAISYHRRLRGRRSLASVLDEIPGIGPKRKAALIKRFGSLEGLSRAKVEEIVSLAKIPRSIAQEVVDRFQAGVQ
ncbi:MAG: excinuclease ABC subunit UvrC [Candidatus Bipolaricaulota bacterium]